MYTQHPVPNLFLERPLWALSRPPPAIIERPLFRLIGRITIPKKFTKKYMCEVFHERTRLSPQPPHPFNGLTLLFMVD